MQQLLRHFRNCLAGPWKTLLAGLLFSQLSAADPVWPEAQWARADPASLGLDPQALELLDEEIRGGQHGNIDSMIIIRHGQVVFDQEYRWEYAEQHKGLTYPSPPPWDYFNVEAYPFYGETDLHSLQSVSKSVMSALIGIAIARGELPGTESTLGELLPHRHFADAAVKDILLEHVLTMTAGIDWEEDVSYFSLENDATASEAMDDWVGYLLSKPMTMEQGKFFDYNSAASQALSEILATATGVPTDAYANNTFLIPSASASTIGIARPKVTPTEAMVCSLAHPILRGSHGYLRKTGNGRVSRLFRRNGSLARAIHGFRYILISLMGWAMDTNGGSTVTKLNRAPKCTVAGVGEDSFR